MRLVGQARKASGVKCMGSVFLRLARSLPKSHPIKKGAGMPDGIPAPFPCRDDRQAATRNAAIELLSCPDCAFNDWAAALS